MSDFEHAGTSQPFVGAMTSAEAAAVDAGLRAHMLRIYNYMVLGLVITGVAAFAVHALSVTADIAAAAKITRDDIEIPYRVAGLNMYLTPLGYTIFVGPMKWPVILAPLALVFALSFGIERLRPASRSSCSGSTRHSSACRSLRSSWSTPRPRSCGCSS